MLTVILDGNNVFEALHLAQARDAAAAEQFLQRLETVAVSKDWEVIVVFDGHPRFLPRETGPLIVRYAPRRKTADTLIERLVYQTPDRTRVIVVTRDRAEANLVLGLGARVWNVQRLLEEIVRMQQLLGRRRPDSNLL